MNIISVFAVYHEEIGVSLPSILHFFSSSKLFARKDNEQSFTEKVRRAQIC